MPEVVVFRLELSDLTEQKDESSLSSKKSKQTSSLAAGAVAGKVSSSLSTNETLRNYRAGSSGGRSLLRNEGFKTMRESISKKFNAPVSRAHAFSFGAKLAVRNLPYKEMAKGVAGGAAVAGAAYSVYSNYRSSTLSMSGSTHAAALQDRKGQGANALIGIGVAAMINPVLAAPAILMKVYQMSEANRKELYSMKKSQITSAILQRNLVKNVAERRF